MKNKNIISPVGLKGNEINERMKQLMGISSINENKSNIVVELTKMGPDGKAYAIVRENHEYYIKSTTKTSKLVAEDFKYIGGLQNKKQEAYPSYAKAIKHLNLRFNSLSEAFNSEEKINTFLDDNLLSENGLAGGFTDFPKGGGFTGEGNLNGNSALYEEETCEEDEKDEEDYGTHINGTKLEKPNPIVEDDLDETQQAVEDMLNESWMEEEEEIGDFNHNGVRDKQDFYIAGGKDDLEKETNESWMEEGMYDENYMEEDKPTLKNYKNMPEFIEAMDEASAKEILASLYAELGAPVVKAAKNVVGFLGGSDVRDAINKRFPENEGSLYEGKLSINKAIDHMDALIDGLSDSKKKVKTQQ